MGSDRLIYW